MYFELLCNYFLVLESDYYIEYLRFGMASDYNSQLISQLYETFTSNNPSKAIRIVDEMEEIGDVGFIYQIRDAYLRYQNTYSSHYFLSSLGSFKSPEVLKIILELISRPGMKDGDFFWMVDILTTFSHIDSTVAEKAISMVRGMILKPDYNILYFSLQSLLSYIDLCQESAQIYELLLNFVIDHNYDSDVRTNVLHHFIKINPTKSIADLITIFENTKDMQTQVMLAKESIRWQNGNAEDFHEIILKTGNSRAREIVEDYKEKRKRKESKILKTATLEHENRDYRNIVKDIYELRLEINRVCIANTNLSHPIFQDKEDLLTHIWSATNENDLKIKCQSIRDQFRKLDKKISSSGIDESDRLAKIKQFDPYITEVNVNAPLNRLFFYLSNKGISDDFQIFGLRKINRLCNLLGSHDKEQFADLVTVLKEFGIYTSYENKEWGDIHLFILNEYKKSLDVFKQRLLKEDGKK